MEMLSDAWNLAKRLFSNDVFQRALYPVMIVVSILLYADSFYIDEKIHKSLHDGLKSLSEIILTTGLISMFINAFTYMGVFRGALGEVFDSHKDMIRAAADEALVSRMDTIRDAVHDVVYSTEHLRSRTDLPQVWGRVSEAIYGQRFPAIADVLRDTILTNLLPVNKEFYYREYHRNCVVSWADEAASLVQCREEISDLVIVPADPLSTIYYNYSSENDSRTPKELARIELISLTIDGTPHDNALQEEEYEDNLGGRGLRQSYSIPLRGKASYRVKRVLRRTVALNRDPILDYRSTNFIAGPTSVRVQTQAPNLVPHVIGNASDDFANRALKKSDARVWDIELEYAGLIFPNQGYILLLQRLDASATPST